MIRFEQHNLFTFMVSGSDKQSVHGLRADSQRPTQRMWGKEKLL